MYSMNYNFLNETFMSVIEGERVNISDLEKYITFQEKSFILKHNIEALSKIIKFLKSSENIFILNGFMGSGKTYVADCVLDFISEDVLIFRNSYQEAINIDDIQLSMFKDFQIYHNENKVTLPKVESNIFSDKINAYIKYCDKPMLFIFDSLEINMRSASTQNDILDFLNYLSHFAKVKIIICSRTFKQSDLISTDSSETYTLSSITKEEMYEYLEINKIDGTRFEIEELYKITRGHYLLLELSVFIMQILGTSLTIFASEYKKSTKNFLEFLINKILSVSTERFLKVLIFLALIRHGSSLDFLINQNISQEDDLNFLIQKRVITEKFDRYYIKDYIKTEFLKTINIATRIKMHKFIKEVYEQELPLKPFERQLFLSRLTMRQEIAYHDKRINTLEEELAKTKTPRAHDAQGMPYLSYVRSSGYNVINEKKSVPKRYKRNLRQKNNTLSAKDVMLYANTTNEDIFKEQFKPTSYVKENSTEKISNTISNTISNIVPDGIDDYIKLGKECEKEFNFSDAVLYYRKALTYNNEKDFKEKEPLIYLNIANCYKHLQEIDKAVDIYEKVYQIYSSASLYIESNEVLRTLAHIYCELYKYDNAKEVYNRILKSNFEGSEELHINIYLELAELEDNIDNIESEKEYIKKALSIAEKYNKIQLLAKCYFKYALLMDDLNNIEEAQKYYLRCVQSSQDIKDNPDLASAYFNLAEISLYKNNNTASKMYYELAINADKQMENYEGLYESYTKLAKLYRVENAEKALDYLIDAVNCAKKLEDTSLVVYSYVDIGDFYLNQFNNKEAVRSYMLAKTLSGVDIDLDKIIEQKLSRIKIAIGQDEYENLIKDIKKFR